MTPVLIQVLALNLALLAGGGAFLVHRKATQKLGNPGVRAEPSRDPLRMQILLPKDLPDYRCEPQQPTADELGVLPKDTSIARNRYFIKDSFLDLSVVMMGSDRTSIHQPQFCLTGQGWKIDQSEVVRVPVVISKAEPEMAVMKLTTTKEVKDAKGQPLQIRGIFVYWFVAEGAQTALHSDRMWMMAKSLLSTGVLQRWAYVTCFIPCFPGQEAEAFRRLSAFLGMAVPKFQTL